MESYKLIAIPNVVSPRFICRKTFFDNGFNLCGGWPIGINRTKAIVRAP